MKLPVPKLSQSLYWVPSPHTPPFNCHKKEDVPGFIHFNMPECMLTIAVAIGRDWRSWGCKVRIAKESNRNHMDDAREKWGLSFMAIQEWPLDPAFISHGPDVLQITFPA